MNTPESTPPRAGATILLVATFALGMIAGAAILHMARSPLGGPPPPGPGGPPPIEHLRHELDLDAEQVDQLREILEESRPRMRAEADRTRDRIRAILRPDQQERFDAMRPPAPPGAPPPPPGPGRRPPGGRRPAP